MYPAHGLALFPPFPRDERVFVAMPFDDRLQRRWEQVIAPGISAANLSPFRVDIPKTSNSIPAEIIRGIAQSRLVLADVTRLDGHRNGNVMYEVGIAHASRQPEEVLLFRSDNDPLLFDVATIRVNTYEPDGQPDQARSLITEAVLAALREVNTLKSATVEQVVNTLDVPSIEVLMVVGAAAGKHTHPASKTMRDVLSHGQYVQAIARLLGSGLIVAASAELSPEMYATLKNGGTTDFLRALVTYQLTPFGGAALTRLSQLWRVDRISAELGGPA